EVPASYTAFHGEKMDLGAYRLRVRAIDREEYLGVAAEHGFRFVEAHLEVGPGNVTPREIEANPYGVLRLGTPDASGDLEMALDDGPFGPVLDTIDLRRRAPHVLRLRRRGSTSVETIPIRYAEVKASVEASPSAEGITLRGQISNVKGIGQRVHPS